VDNKEFDEKYILESDGKYEVSVGVFIDDCNNSFFVAKDTWEDVTVGGGLDNDAIDAIITMLERARAFYNS
jgi:hypothetical protein